MASNTGKGVRVAYKAEASFGAEASGAGAKVLRYIPSTGFTYGRELIESQENRADGQSGMPRLGYQSVQFSYSGELSIGTYTEPFEAVLRGTAAAGVIKPAATPVRRSFTIEEYLQDIDLSEVLIGCRFLSMRVAAAARGFATVEFGGVGRTADAKDSASSPVFSSPTETTTKGLILVDATLSFNGTPMTTATALNFAVELGGEGEALIGTTLTDDIYDGRMRITGDLSAVTTDLAFLGHVKDEDVVSVELSLQDPEMSGDELTITIPKIVLNNKAAPVGSDNGRIQTMQFAAGYDPVLGGMISIEEVAGS